MVVHGGKFHDCTMYKFGHYFGPQLFQGLKLLVCGEGGGEEVSAESPCSGHSVLLGHSQRFGVRRIVVQAVTVHRF